MRFHDLVRTSHEVAGTRSRLRKTELLAEALRGLDPAERPIGAAFLSGEPRQRRLEVGWAGIRDTAPPPAREPTLTLTEVDDAFAALVDVSGAGARGDRLAIVGDLFARATEDEQAHLRGLLLRELRQGALLGSLIPAVADAADVDEDGVRRALMLSGDIGAVVQDAFEGGDGTLAAYRLELFRPVLPMLAQTAPSAAEAVVALGECEVEEKLDGARVQVHRDGEDVRLYTRNLNDVTDRVPELVAAAQQLRCERAILDGEAIALTADGRPRPFQETMSRFGSGTADADTPLVLALFDVLLVDDDHAVLDRPLVERLEVLDRIAPADLRVRRLRTADPDAGTDHLRAALARGHEGVVVKDLAAPYAAGRRGSAWRKVKPAFTLDLVVLAAEWGSGRRTGWLSNLHLGARDDRPGHEGLVMLGKTFKGLTDDLLRWQTERLLELEERRTTRTVHVRPEVVVEVAFDGVQTSRRYPGGVALRFARVRGYRPDRSPDDADTLSTILAIRDGTVRPQV